MKVAEIKAKNQLYIGDGSPTSEVQHARQAEINDDILDKIEELENCCELCIEYNDDFIKTPS